MNTPLKAIFISTSLPPAVDSQAIRGQEISMKDLAETIRALTGFPGDIIWDTTQPNGQPRRKLDTSRALKRFGWKATTPLAEGLRKTLDWYVGTRAA